MRDCLRAGLTSGFPSEKIKNGGFVFFPDLIGGLAVWWLLFLSFFLLSL